LKFIGFELDNTANRSSLLNVSLPKSKPVLIIPADEEGMIRDYCLKYLALQ
jgi:acetate kinase